MVMPQDIINTMGKLHFSAKLCRIIKRLFDEDYDVNIDSMLGSSFVADPLKPPPGTIRIHIRKDLATINFKQVYSCILPSSFDGPMALKRCKDIYDSLADKIYNDIFAKEDESKPRILTISKEENSFFKSFREELKSRGDFTIDIPKFVDILFKLGIMKPKEE